MVLYGTLCILDHLPSTCCLNDLDASLYPASQVLSLWSWNPFLTWGRGQSEKILKSHPLAPSQMTKVALWCTELFEKSFRVFLWFWERPGFKEEASFKTVQCSAVKAGEPWKFEALLKAALLILPVFWLVSLRCSPSIQSRYSCSEERNNQEQNPGYWQDGKSLLRSQVITVLRLLWSVYTQRGRLRYLTVKCLI